MNASKPPLVTVRMASGGKIVFELYPEYAPNACNSLIYLAKNRVFDGWPVDRIVPGFVIQPRYADEGKPEADFDIDGEFADNGYESGLPMSARAVAMAGDGKTISSGSSFFISLEDNERLNGRFTVVGKVVEGWEEVKRIEAVPTYPVDSGVPGVIINTPVNAEIIESVTVDTFGKDYPPPVKRVKTPA